MVRVEPGLQAAFIDYGAERLGFLQMGELHPSFFRAWEKRSEGKRARITDVLQKRQDLLVQVTKEERGTKGAALTTYVSLPGRYMVLMPDSDTKGVSRKIEEESQRRKLKEAMSSLNLPSQMGYIVRTAGIDQSKEELKRDFDYLVRVHENIQSLGAQVKAPALIYKESNLVIRSIRDYFSADMDEVLVDDERVFQEATEFFKQVMPDYVRLVKLHQERRPIFSRYQIEEQIETIYRNKVLLPSGGSIVIDATEALVAIDVNSGKMAGEHGVEATAYKTNLEAATEVGRQLRLRDLGGLIVIDFIDMRDRKHIREVEKCLRDALKNDKARVTLGRISQFGLLEMSRQRIKATLAEGAYLSCPHCNGSGRIKSAEAQGIAFLRRIHAGVAKGQIGRVEGEVPLEVATYLLNSKKEELLELERRHNVSIFIKGRPDFTAGQTEANFLKREKEEAQEAVEAVTALSLAVSEVEEEMTTAAEDEGEPVTEEGNKRKRKRSRRKKKPAGEEPLAATPPEAAAEPAAAPAESAPQADAEPVTAGEPPTESAEQPSEEEGQKRKRRRRRRKKPAEHPAPEEAAASAAPTEGAPAEPTAPKQEPEAPQPQAQPQAQRQAQTQAHPQTEQSAEAPTPEETAPQAKPAAKKPQRRRKKPEEAVASVAPAANPSETAPSPSESTGPGGAETRPAQAAKETLPAIQAATQAGTATAGAPEATPSSAPPSDAENAAPKEEKPKPARKRAPRKKPAAAAEPEKTAATQEKKPQQSAQGQPVPQETAAANPEAAEAPPAEAPVEAKKPARKRTPRSVKTEDGEKKTPARRKPAAKKKEEASTAAPEEKPAPKRAASTTRKRTAASPEAKEETETKKKRPARKKATDAPKEETTAEE